MQKDQAKTIAPKQAEQPGSSEKNKAERKGKGFTFATTKEFEPDLSDEALENMVPPPKRKIRED